MGTFCRSSIDINVHHHFHLTYDVHCRCVVNFFCRGLTTTTGVIQLVMFCFTGLARQMDGFLMSHIFTFCTCTFNCTPFLTKYKTWIYTLHIHYTIYTYWKWTLRRATICHEFNVILTFVSISFVFGWKITLWLKETRKTIIYMKKMSFVIFPLCLLLSYIMKSNHTHHTFTFLAVANFPTISD